MPQMQFGLSAFVRGRGDLPELPVVNMFAEDAPTEETGIVLQSRPGLSDRGADMGSGPVEGLFQRNGVLSGALFGISGGALYNTTSLVSAISGSGAVSMAGNEAGLMATAGAALYLSTNGTTAAQVSFPDSANVRKIVNGASRFIALRDGTGKFYWTAALGTTFDALDFATAESAPDGLLDALFIDDGLILFGNETVEFWPNTADADLPFQPLEGRVFEKGVKATGCATSLGSGFAWVTNRNEVCVNEPDNVITHPGLQALIESTSAARLFTFLIDGVEFLALRIDAGTWVFSTRSQRWSTFASYGESNWLVRCHANGVFGSGDGATLAFNAVHADLDGVLERRFRAGVPIDSSGFAVDNIGLRLNPGQTPYLTGEYAEPMVELRLSRDAGQEWGNWRPVSLGTQGRYRQRPQWRSLGMASRPGLLGEFRTTAPVPFRVSAALLNEPYGGR